MPQIKKESFSILFKKLMLVAIIMMIVATINAQIVFVGNWGHNPPLRFDTIQEGFDAVQEGGTVRIMPDTYTGPGNTNLIWPTGKNFHLQGLPGTIIDAQGVFGSVGITMNSISRQSTIRNIEIRNASTAIQMNSSNPLIEQVKIAYNSRGIVINNSVNFHNEVLLQYCEFIGNWDDPILSINGAALIATTGNLTVNESSFIGNKTFAPSNSGAAIHFTGNSINLHRNNFSDNQGGYQCGNIVIQTGNPVTNPSVNISRNTFVDNYTFRPSVLEVVHDLFILNQSNIVIEYNTFKEISYNPDYDYAQLSLESSIYLQGNNNIRFINNTMLGNEHTSILASPTNTGTFEIINSLFTGLIDIHNAVNLSVSHSWFKHPQIFPTNAQITKVYYGDPVIDNLTYKPLWNADYKSKLIDNGQPTLNGTPWYLDLSNQDPDGTRKDIGAALAQEHGSIVHYLTRPIALTYIDPIDLGPTLPLRVDKFNWVSFPYIDKLYEGQIDDEHSADELYYNLHKYSDNELFTEGLLEKIVWNYNSTEKGEIKWTGVNWGDNIPTSLNSRYGYKIELTGTARPTPPYPIVVSGFLFGNEGNELGNYFITLEGKDPGTDEREIWVGYYKKTSERPLYALQDVLPFIKEIKTQKWTVRKDDNGNWIEPAGFPKINFGEAVSLKFTSNVSKNFTWKINDTPPNNAPYIHPVTKYFIYEEQIDYTPIYIYLPEEYAVEEIGEIGLLVNNELVGAEVIMGEIVQLNAYILETDLEDAEIEFQIVVYGARSGARTMGNYTVQDSKTSLFQDKKLDLNTKDDFYIVSFKNEKSIFEDEIITKTFIEGNHPNPFNPSTTIAYTLGQSGNVKLQVYNIRGQMINTLIDTVQTAGRHTVIWNGDDSNKNSVSSGVYFYKLETDSGSEINRMVLMK